MTGKRLDLKPAVFHKTDYKGVLYLETAARTPNGKVERVYYIRYRTPDRREHFEKAGDQYRHRMTPAKAAAIRSARATGKELPNEDRREAAQEAKEAAAGRWTLTRLWDDYKAHRYGDSPPPTEKANWKNHLSPNFGEKTPDEISTIDVERLKSTLTKAGKKPGTVAKVTELLRRLINFGVDREYYPAPSVRVKLPRVPLDRDPEFLSDVELSRLIGVLDTYEDATVANIVRLALLTGMRRGELLRLEWDHIDLKRGFLRIKQSKGGTDESIPLSDAARAMLSSLPRTASLVFPGRTMKKKAADGKQETVVKQRQDVNRHAKAIKEAAKLPASFRLFHGSRHHFASTLASSGVDLYTVGKLLTHKSPQMTKRYSHLSNAALRSAANVMGQSFKGIEKSKEQEKVETA
jgi:integrase